MPEPHPTQPPAYTPPAIVYEAHLEVRAGTPLHMTIIEHGQKYTFKP